MKEHWVNPHRKERIGTVQAMYDGALMPDLQANTFRNIDRLFTTRHIAHDPNNIWKLSTARYPIEELTFRSNHQTYDLYDYLSLNRISGVIVVKNGDIHYENYQLGNSDQTHWMSMSIAKSITATLAGIALKEGAIGSLNDTITTYLPELKGSGYEGVNIRQLLTMTSGVQWNETYTDPNSDRRKMLEIQKVGIPDGILRLMSTLPRIAQPGTRWNYSTGETHVLGALVNRAVNESLSDYLSEKIWKNMGMESSATWWLESPDGLEVGGSGISASLRDYARFGLFLLNHGCTSQKDQNSGANDRAKSAGDQPESLLPDGWIEAASSPIVIEDKTIDYGYMLWPVKESRVNGNRGAFKAMGIFGQTIYINPTENIVIVEWAAQSKPEGRVMIKGDDFYAAIVERLK